MRTLKHLLFTAIACTALLSCAKEFQEPAVQELQSMTFSAVSAETKTSISGVKVNWAPGDVIGIIDNVSPTTVHQFTTNISAESATADFSGEVSEGATEFYAVYPYDVAASADFSAGTVSTKIPAEQSLKAGSGSALVTVCKADGNSLTFHHACGIVAVTLKGSDNIGRIILRGNAGEKISGSATLTVSGSSVSTAVSGSGYLVDAAPASGSTFVDGTYYLAVAPQTLSAGLTAHLFRTDNSEADGSVSTEVAFAPGKGFDLGTVSPAEAKYKASVGKGQTDVYVSPDGSEGDGTGSDASNPMAFSRFQEIMAIGGTSLGATTYSLYAYKAQLIKDRTFHLISGTYTPTKSIAPYANYGSGAVAFKIVGDSGAESTIIDGMGNTFRAFGFYSVTKPSVEGITVQNCTVGSEGAAVNITTAQGVSFKDCIFKNNTTSGDKKAGGAVHINKEKTKVSFTGCTFAGNTASGYGGAIHVNSVADIWISESVFSNNSSLGGGAISMPANVKASLFITDCRFKDNVATNSSGAILVGSDGGNNSVAVGPTVSFDNCSFSGNKSTNSHGGVSYIRGGCSQYNNCIISGNYAKNTGGAFYCGTGALMLNRCSLTGNSATTTNVVHTSSAENGAALMNNCTVQTASDASASNDIYSKSTFILTNCTLVSEAAGHTALKIDTADRGIFAGNIISAAGTAVSGGTDKDYNILSEPEGFSVSGDGSYYFWNGTTSFTKPTRAQLEAIIKSATEGKNVKGITATYAEWLAAKDGFTTDMAGNTRNTEALWPGSYQATDGATVLNGTTIVPGNDSYGLISDSSTGKGIPGVPVTDGFKFVTTDANGVYQMAADASMRRIYYTLPAGYAVSLDAGKRPVFFGTPAASGRCDFSLTPEGSGQDAFTLLMMGDPQIQGAKHLARFNTETVPDVVATLNAQQAGGRYRNVRGIVLGDMAYDNSAIWTELKDATSNVQLASGEYLPLYQTMGNHDKDSASEDDPDGLFIGTFGPTNYSLNIGKMHLVVMDNVRTTTREAHSYPNGYKWNYKSGFTDAQLEWLRQDLALVENPSGKLLIFCAHIPIRNTALEASVLPLLSAFGEAHIMSAHTHYAQNYIHTGYVCKGGQPIYEHIHGAACGAFWHSNLNGDGQPQGYSLYEIEGDSVKNWVAKGTGCELSHQMRVYDGNDTYDSAYPYHWYETNYSGSYACKGNGALKSSFVASVWNDDDANWTLEMYKDGAKAGDFTHLAPGSACDVCSTTFFFKNGHISNYYNVSAPGHIWYYTTASGDPSSETGWEVVATQTIPSSGERNIYRASTLQKDYTGFSN